MIHKVNRPVALKLDSGSSQNGGLSYHGPSSPEPQPEKREEQNHPQDFEQEEKKVALRLVASVEQAGMTEVVKDLLQDLQAEEPQTLPGLSFRYRAEPALPKGMVVNRKAE